MACETDVDKQNVGRTLIKYDIIVWYLGLDRAFQFDDMVASEWLRLIGKMPHYRFSGSASCSLGKAVSPYSLIGEVETGCIDLSGWFDEIRVD
jgi:hypothetical protein